MNNIRQEIFSAMLTEFNGDLKALAALQDTVISDFIEQLPPHYIGIEMRELLVYLTNNFRFDSSDVPWLRTIRDKHNPQAIGWDMEVAATRMTQKIIYVRSVVELLDNGLPSMPSIAANLILFRSAYFVFISAAVYLMRRILELPDEMQSERDQLKLQMRNEYLPLLYQFARFGPRL